MYIRMFAALSAYYRHQYALADARINFTAHYLLFTTY